MDELIDVVTRQAYNLVADCWARGFDIEQTCERSHINRSFVEMVYRQEQTKFDAWAAEQEKKVEAEKVPQPLG